MNEGAPQAWTRRTQGQSQCSPAYRGAVVLITKRSLLGIGGLAAENAPQVHVYAAFGAPKERDGLAQVSRQWELLRLDRHARWINVPLERECSLKLPSGPELRRRQNERRGGEDYRQA